MSGCSISNKDGPRARAVGQSSPPLLTSQGEGQEMFNSFHNWYYFLCWSWAVHTCRVQLSLGHGVSGHFQRYYCKSSDLMNQQDKSSRCGRLNGKDKLAVQRCIHCAQWKQRCTLCAICSGKSSALAILPFKRPQRDDLSPWFLRSELLRGATALHLQPSVLWHLS